MRTVKIPILLVEDDLSLQFIVKDNLEQNNYKVDVASDGETALQIFNTRNYALVLLDVMLPRMDGFSIARQIRKDNEQIPILFLTARAMTDDKILGLKSGGDDYITKPFSMEELMLRMEIFLRRSLPVAEQQSETTYTLGSYEYVESQLLLKHPGGDRRLTLKESELVKLFARNPGRILNREEILLRIWGSDDYFMGRSLDVFISRLRKYFQGDPSIAIVNQHGVGFRLVVGDNRMEA